MESTSPDIRAEPTDGVARLTIDRVERRNALSWEAISTLRALLSQAGADRAVRVVACACDLVVAADDATFGAPEVDVGLWPP